MKNIHTMSDIANATGRKYHTVADRVRRGVAPQPTGVIGGTIYWDDSGYDAMISHMAQPTPGEIVSQSHDQIKQWIDEGITQTEIAQRLGVSQSIMSKHVRASGLQAQVWREPEEKAEDRFEVKVQAEVKRRLRAILEGLEG